VFNSQSSSFHEVWLTRSFPPSGKPTQGVGNTPRAETYSVDPGAGLRNLVCSIISRLNRTADYGVTDGPSI